LTMLAALGACQSHSYNGIAKIGNFIYLTGQTNYFGYNSPWVKRCSELNGDLVCEEVNVRHDDPASSPATAPISTADSAAAEAEMRSVLNSSRDAILDCIEKKFANVKATVQADSTMSVQLTGDLAGTPKEKCIQTAIGIVHLKTAKPGVVLIHNLP